MDQRQAPGFADSGALQWLCRASPDQLDSLPFGVIGFGLDADAVVQRYNRNEREGSGLTDDQVLGRPLFAEVAQCMHNYLVAQRFVDAQDSAQVLDVTLPYVFTLRMRPTPVVLRLLAAPGESLRFVLVQRNR